MNRLKIRQNTAYRLNPASQRFECQPIIDWCLYFDMPWFRVDLDSKHISQSDLVMLISIKDFLSFKHF